MTRVCIGLLLLALVGCSTERPYKSEHLPYALSTAGKGIVHIGRRVPGAQPGEVVEYGNLALPDGVTRAWVEVDANGNAASFELWFDPERSYAGALAFYGDLLGFPTSRFARLAGDCTVWEDELVRFEVCQSRDVGEHGFVIAHAYAVTPVEV